jgi:hypothetical protein
MSMNSGLQPAARIPIQLRTPQLRNLPDIIDLIVGELGNPDARAEAAQAIERSFGFFRRHDKWFARAGKAALADDAKEIARSIAALESTLAAASAPLHDFLFMPLRGRAGQGV